MAVADLTAGELSSRGTLERRERETRRAIELLGLTDRYSLSPSFIMDVSSVWERRMAAVRAYESQFMAGQQTATTALSRPGFLRALEARAVWLAG